MEHQRNDGHGEEAPRRGTMPPVVDPGERVDGGAPMQRDDGRVETGPDDAGEGSPVRSDGGRVETGPDDGDDGDDGDDENVLFGLGFETIADHIDAAIFTLDTEGNVRTWNRAAEALTGVPPEEAKEAEMASQAFYHDGRRSMTLADKILEAPERTDEEFDVARVDDVEYTLYTDRSVFSDARGDERHMEFSAAPLYRDGDLVGVVEILQDRTEDARYRNEMDDMVVELNQTMDAIGDGVLDARAEFESRGYLDEELVGIVDSLNEMAVELEATMERIAAHTRDLQGSAESVAASSGDISDLASEQFDDMTAVANEVADMSATVEEIASTASGVEETSSEAADAAEEGYDSAEDAVSEMRDVAEAADDVATDVDELQRRVAEIDEIVEVINDIADQTNLLALNASIEAARAGEAGEGFAVVADEVKNLAEESQQQAGQIEATVAAIQEDTANTVASLEAMNRNVDSGIEEVEGAMGNFEDIVAMVKETEEGIAEVSRATDEQASSTEEIATMVNEAVGTADSISEEADEIASATRRQTDRIDETNALLEEFAGEALDGEVEEMDGIGTAAD